MEAQGVMEFSERFQEALESGLQNSGAFGPGMWCFVWLVVLGLAPVQTADTPITGAVRKCLRKSRLRVFFVQSRLMAHGMEGPKARASGIC